MHINDISPEDYPLSENFRIELKDTDFFGKNLYFEDKEASLSASFNYWDHADSKIKDYSEKNIPLGCKDDPFIDLEQNFRICIFKDGNYVYVLQGWDPSEDIYFIWFKVDYEKYRSEWLRIIEVAKESCDSFLSLEDALTADPLNVKELVMNYRGFKKFPEDIFSFRNLEKLKFMGDKFSEVPGEIGELKKLKVLAFSGSGLATLPSEMKNLSSLKELFLNHNNFTEFPPEVLEIEGLELLDLCDNSEIKSIPDKITLLKNMKNLWLNRMDISSIPENVGDLKKLVLLSISGNSIEELPESLCKLEKLETFYCTQTNLKKLPQNLNNLKLIRVFQVSTNTLPRAEIERGEKILKKAFIF